VHAGASGVGSAAIQLAHVIGARVIATAGTDAKLELCRALGAEHVVHRERDDFADAVLAATGGEGTHLVVDFVGAPYWAANLQALRRQGRLVLVGFLGGSQGELDLGPIMRKSLRVSGATLRAMPLARKAALVERCADFVLPRFADGRLRAVVDRAFPLAEAGAAHAYMSENRNLGKIVLEV
jgi:NADPH:quinone reductase-like Zn-dependent oxidoreductase